MLIAGAKLIPTETFDDNRGSVGWIWKENESLPRFVEDRFAVSGFRVLRGFHGDDKTWKLCACLQGEIKFVLVDARYNSPTYKVVEQFKLNSGAGAILVPPGVVNAHQVETDSALLYYKWSEPYNLENQITVAWNDRTIGVQWIQPILSERDKLGSRLEDVAFGRPRKTK